jgi:uncharacterized protein (DUF433 family)
MCYTLYHDERGSKEVTLDWQERIVIDPDILAGKPIVGGTRLAVEFIIDLLAQGWTEAELLRNYPGLTHEDVQACLSYASATLQAERVYPLVVA